MLPGSWRQLVTDLVRESYGKTTLVEFGLNTTTEQYVQTRDVNKTFFQTKTHAVSSFCRRQYTNNAPG